MTTPLFSGSWEDTGVTFFGGSAAVCVNSGHAATFLARTSGLDGTHIAAYTALLDGLDTDALSCKFDFLQIYATQDSTTAHLNLVVNNYNATEVNTPVFTADRGFTGSGAPSRYLGTGFNPFTAVNPNFVRDSGHISAWIVNNLNPGGSFPVGESTAFNTNITGLHARYSDNKAYFYVNSTVDSSVASVDSRGHFIANRTTSSAIQGYKNGASILTDNANTSAAVANLEFWAGGQNRPGGLGCLGFQVAAVSAGSSLSSTDATNFYNRLRTYMTAVGVP